MMREKKTEELDILKEEVNLSIEENINKIKKNTSKTYFQNLYNKLQEKPSYISEGIIQGHGAFKTFTVQKFQKETQKTNSFSVILQEMF